MVTRVVIVLLLAAASARGQLQVEVTPDLEELQALHREAFHVFKGLDILSLLQRVDPTTQCGKDIDHSFDQLGSGKAWASRMFDSIDKFPSGILMGHTAILGLFDECVAVEDSSIDFIGQHCFVKMSMKLSANSSLAFQYGLCVPSSCTAEDLISGLNGNLPPTLQGLISFNTSIYTCKTRDYIPMEAGDWVVVAMLVCFGLVACASTAYDVWQRRRCNNSKPHPLLASFSVYTNGSSLFQVSPGGAESGQLMALHGLRTLSMAWVVISHSHIYAFLTPLLNYIDAFGMLTDVGHIFMSNGYPSVDSFFFLSGLLVCFVFFREIGRKGSYDAPLGYIHRYLRLTPPYALMVLLQSTILPKIATGPAWDTTNMDQAHSCRTNWWEGLIYLQNYLVPDSVCLGQSWYLSADMQLYWISPIILYPLYLWPVVGSALLGLLILGGTALVFALAYVNDLGPSNLMAGAAANQNAIDYSPAYTRAVPWLIGVALGYVICGIKAKKIKVRMSTVVVIAAWLVTSAVCLSIVMCFHFFSVPQWASYTTLEAAFYLSLYRLGWGLGLAWIVFACVHGYGGPVNGFLSWGIFQPLGKLSYCVFICHGLIIEFRTGNLRTEMYTNNVVNVYNFLGDYVLAHLVAIPVSLLFEMPFINIERYLMRDVKILPYPKPKPKRDRQERVETDAVSPPPALHDTIKVNLGDENDDLKKADEKMD